MYHTNQTTNALEAFAPFDKGYLDAYWASMLNERSDGISFGFKYKKTVSLQYTTLQVGEVSLKHLMYVRDFESVVMKSAWLISMCIRMEGRKLPIIEVLKMPESVFTAFYDALID